MPHSAHEADPLLQGPSTRKKELKMLLKLVTKFAMKFVPKEHKALIEAAMRVFGNLNTKVEFDAAMDYFIMVTQSDG